MPVQFFPNYISPLYNSAIEEANEVDFEGVHSKFVSLEYLIALLLTAFRPKDKINVQSLLERADKDLLLRILKRFNNEQYPIYERFKEILANTPES